MPLHAAVQGAAEVFETLVQLLSVGQRRGWDIYEFSWDIRPVFTRQALWKT